MTPPNLIEAVEEVARLCGAVALGHFRKGLDVEWKVDGSEVTRADREAESAAREWIQKHFPNDGIVGEEFGSEGQPGRRRWLIDPIDGTRSYVRGVPLWGSMIAIEENGTVLAGAINCAATGDLVIAAPQQGCWHNGVRASVSAVASISNATVLCTSALFRYNPARARRWTTLTEQAAITRSWGDCYGYVLVATGRAEVMVDDRLSPWDVAALVPIIEEAGGVFTDWKGRRGPGNDAVASNGLLADEVRKILGVPEHSDA